MAPPERRFAQFVQFVNHFFHGPKKKSKGGGVQENDKKSEMKMRKGSLAHIIVKNRIET